MSRAPREHVLILRVALAFIWLATGLAVLHPYYREVGERYLGLLGLPPWVMSAACVVEVALGLRVLLGPAATWLALLQAGMIVAFTVVLAWIEPAMLWHPLGVLTKNVPLLALVGTLWLVEREGWTARARWLLRGGMASIWLLEGLLPDLLFPGDDGERLIASTGLAGSDPRLVLRLSGAAMMVSAVLALVLRGPPLRWLLLAQCAGLVAICVLLTRFDPLQWFHPFGPATKNVSILLGTLLVWRLECEPASMQADTGEIR
jgi:hypothetical protein